MASIFNGGDDDGVEEGPSNNHRPLRKKPRTSNFIVDTPRLSNSDVGNPNSTSGAPEPSVQEDNSGAIDDDSPDAVPSEEEEGYEEEEEEEGYDEEEEGYEEEEEEEEEEQLNRGGEVHPTEALVNSIATENGAARGEMRRSLYVKLTDPDVLDCEICLEPLSSPVYQCLNGHIACASCCTKMWNKCASCCMPIIYRCRAIEKVLESIEISCLYKNHGCKESLIHSKKLDHEKTCTYAPCSCPYPGCNYVGLSKCLYTHFTLRHSTFSIKFHYSRTFVISLGNNEKQVFLQESKQSVLFILNRSIEPLGSCVSVICIAPSSSKKGFRYAVRTKDGESSIKFRTVIESYREWTAEAQAKKCLIVPKDFMSSTGQLKLELRIYEDR